MSVSVNQIQAHYTNIKIRVSNFNFQGQIETRCIMKLAEHTNDVIWLRTVNFTSAL